MNHDPMPPSPYLLLFRNTSPDTYRHLSADQRQELVTQWNAWFEKLVTAGKATEGQPLEDATRVVTGVGSVRVTDGPFPEAKEAIGGYVKLLVADMDEATEIAKQHPAIAHGLVIEIRQLTPNCHLGVNTMPSGATEIAAH